MTPAALWSIRTFVQLHTRKHFLSLKGSKRRERHTCAQAHASTHPPNLMQMCYCKVSAELQRAQFHQVSSDRKSPTPMKSIELRQGCFSTLCTGPSTVGALWGYSQPLPHKQVAPNKNLRKYTCTGEIGCSDYFEIAVS